MLLPAIFIPRSSFKGWGPAALLCPSELLSEKESGVSGQEMGASGGKEGSAVAGAEQSSHVAAPGLAGLQRGPAWPEGRERVGGMRGLEGKSSHSNAEVWRGREGGETCPRIPEAALGGTGRATPHPQHTDLLCTPCSMLHPTPVPHPSQAAPEAPGWTPGFCTHITFPDFRGTLEVCSREPMLETLHSTTTLQAPGRRGQSQSRRRATG